MCFNIAFLVTLVVNLALSLSLSLSLSLPLVGFPLLLLRTRQGYYEKQIQKCQKIAVEQLHDTSWTFVERTRDIDVYSRQDPGSHFLTYKSVSVLQTAAVVAHEVFSSLGHRRSWDETFQEGRVVFRHDPLTHVQYLCFHGSWPAKGRDLCLISRTVFADDRSIFLFTTSVEHSECPEHPDYVRGDLFAGAIHLRPLTAHSCQVFFLFSFDPKLDLGQGGLAVLLVNKANIQSVLVLEKVRQYIESSPHLFADRAVDESPIPMPSPVGVGRPAMAVAAVAADVEPRVDEFIMALDVAERLLRNEVAMNLAASDAKEGADAASTWQLHSRQNDVDIYTKVDGAVQYCKGITCCHPLFASFATISMAIVCPPCIACPVFVIHPVMLRLLCTSCFACSGWALFRCGRGADCGQRGGTNLFGSGLARSMGRKL